MGPEKNHVVTWMDLGSRFSGYIQLRLMIGEDSSELIWDYGLYYLATTKIPCCRQSS